MSVRPRAGRTFHDHEDAHRNLSSGYSLSASFSALSITGTGVVQGVTSAAYGGGAGGTGVFLAFAAPVTSDGVVTGGAGGSGAKVGGKSEGGEGGGGGVGMVFAKGGSLAVRPPQRRGGRRGRRIGPAGGPGGAGGDGGDFAAAGSVQNLGMIFGGRRGRRPRHSWAARVARAGPES